MTRATNIIVTLQSGETRRIRLEEIDSCNVHIDGDILSKGKYPMPLSAAKHLATLRTLKYCDGQIKSISYEEIK